MAADEEVEIAEFNDESFDDPIAQRIMAYTRLHQHLTAMPGKTKRSRELYQHGLETLDKLAHSFKLPRRGELSAIK